MRPTIIAASIFVLSCSATPDQATPPKPPAVDAVPEAIEAPPEPVKPEQPHPEIPPVQTVDLKPLTSDEVDEIGDINDDVSRLEAVQRKALRKWLRDAKESVALAEAREDRDAFVADIAKPRKRKAECLLVLMGQKLADSDERQARCGKAQWVIDERGRAIGVK